MGHPSVIWWIRLETDGKDIVLVVSRNMHILGASLVMLKVKSCKLQLRDMLGALQGEAMKLFTRFGVLGQVCYRGVSPSLKPLKPQNILPC